MEKVWIVLLDDRHFDTTVDVYATQDGAMGAAESLVESYDADHGGKYPLTRTDHGDGVVSWYRDDGPSISVEQKDVAP